MKILNQNGDKVGLLLFDQNPIYQECVIRVHSETSSENPEVKALYDLQIHGVMQYKKIDQRSFSINEINGRFYLELSLDNGFFYKGIQFNLQLSGSKSSVEYSLFEKYGPL